MTKASIGLPDLRRRIYVKAKAEPSWRFWGLYVHVGKVETLRAAYEMAKQNDGAPGVDGVTFSVVGDLIGPSSAHAYLRFRSSGLLWMATTQQRRPGLAPGLIKRNVIQGEVGRKHTI